MQNTILNKRRTLFGVLVFCSLICSSLALSQTVETINEQKLDSLIANRNGKILLLNIWATWCVPCREEFPDIIQLSKNFRDIEVVAISADFPDEVETHIIPFLQKMNVPFRVFVADFANQDEFFSVFDKRWGGEIPATFIYDTTGKQFAFMRGKHSYAEFKNVVEEANEKR